MKDTKLNYNLVRDILIEISQSDNLTGPTDDEIRQFADKNDVSINELAFTLDRLKEADLITGKVTYAGNEPYVFLVGNLTWDGNQYLDSIKTSSVWTETKKKIKETGISTTFSVITAVATAIAKQKLGL